jgi:hypothetical protein
VEEEGRPNGAAFPFDLAKKEAAPIGRGLFD